MGNKAADMSDSVENIQEHLTETVFQHTTSPRKASGRAMGTFVEIITYYLLLSWGLRDSISIETRLPEYGRPDITHNVEYSLHRVNASHIINGLHGRRIGSKAVRNSLGLACETGSNVLLDANNILRNSCRINKPNEPRSYVANLQPDRVVRVAEQNLTPYVIFECKRVGRDAKHARGPQAIEKAKQGSYVARAVSSLQKIRDSRGVLMGVLYGADNVPIIRPYDELIHEIITEMPPEMISDFIMTVGVVSNHGNWFTSNDQNKEMRVLAESYDWVLFLTDQGLTRFVNDTVLDDDKYPEITNAFRKSYTSDRKIGTQFTKLRMRYGAHLELMEYFVKNRETVESWFNVIAPKTSSITSLQRQITLLREKLER